MQAGAAKGLQARKVGQHFVGVVQRLVQLEVVRVAMHKQDLAFELLGLLRQLGHEVAVAAGAGLRAFVKVFGLRQIKARVALGDHHDTGGVLRLGGCK